MTMIFLPLYQSSTETFSYTATLDNDEEIEINVEVPTGTPANKVKKLLVGCKIIEVKESEDGNTGALAGSLIWVAFTLLCFLLTIFIPIALFEDSHQWQDIAFLWLLRIFLIGLLPVAVIGYLLGRKKS